MVDDESVGVFPAGIIVSRKEPFDGETFYYVGSLLRNGYHAGFSAAGQHERSLTLFFGIGRAVDLDFPRPLGAFRDQCTPVGFLGNFPHSGSRNDQVLRTAFLSE